MKVPSEMDPSDLLTRGMTPLEGFGIYIDMWDDDSGSGITVRGSMDDLVITIQGLRCFALHTLGPEGISGYELDKAVVLTIFKALGLEFEDTDDPKIEGAEWARVR